MSMLGKGCGSVLWLRGRGAAEEKFGDDLFEGDVLDGDVGDGAGGEDFLGEGDDAVGGDAEVEFTLFVAGGGTEAGAPGLGETLGADFGEEGDDFLAGAAAVVETGEVAVVDFFAVVDDDDAVAEGLDIGHIVAGEQGGDLVTAVVVAEEVAHGFLGDDVETDGGLVEEKDAGAVEEGGDELHLHALAEGELADHDVELGADIEEGDEFVEGGFVLGGREAVDVA